MNRITSDKPSVREGVGTPRKGKIDYPTWWGLPGGTGGDRSTYEDLGEHYAEEGPFMKDRYDQHPLHSDSLPLLNGKYDHDNPFIVQFGRRGPGGLVVYDVSTAAKGGPNLRDPTYKHKRVPV